MPGHLLQEEDRKPVSQNRTDWQMHGIFLYNNQTTHTGRVPVKPSKNRGQPPHGGMAAHGRHAPWGKRCP